MQKKNLLIHKLKNTKKTQLDKRNTFLLLIQIQNRIKITTTQIERKNILSINENKKISRTTKDSRNGNVSKSLKRLLK